MRVTILILLMVASYSNLLSQQVRITNSEEQVIPYVVVYNQSKNIHVLGNEEGICNLSSFSLNEAIFFQHPSYHIKEYSSLSEIGSTVILEEKVIVMDELVISATRGQNTTETIPYYLKSLHTGSIEYKNAPTAADILVKTGHIAVQKTQSGGGSPIIRGFEANRILLVVDGIRMNNAIYRSGHLQNSITIDPNILQSTEVIFGPSSVMYGSDALGGVIHYISKNPRFSIDDKLNSEAQFSIQGMSASNSMRSNFNYSVGGKKWASLTSISYSNFGDIKMGENRSSDITPSDWGKVYHYADVENGKDIMLPNSDPNVQRRTGYTQYDIMQKVRYKASIHHELGLNFQYSNSSNINRFDQLIRYNDDNTLKYADFYYGPQKRLLAAINSKYSKECVLFNSVNTIAAYQNIKEDRHSRKFNDLEQLNQLETVDVLSLNIDFEKDFTLTTKLNYGLEYTYNNVNSKADYTIDGNFSGIAPTRYPNGGSHTSSISVYTNYNSQLNDLLSLNAGFRYGYYFYNSVFNANDFFTPPVNEFKTSNGAPSASIGLVLKPGLGWRFNGNVTTGFRVPNVDDYGKIRAKNSEISLPNTAIDPEKAVNFELSATKVFGNDIASVNVTYFHTILRDAILRTNLTINGKDSILYDGDWYRMVTNDNVDKALIKGLSAAFQVQPLFNTKISGTYNYTVGRSLSTDEPMGHIPPMFGRIGAEYKYKKLVSELYINYQATKKLEDMSPYGEDNDDAAADIGFPSWQTLNIAFQYPIIDQIYIQASVENILDKHYKSFASPISSPGCNVIISLVGTL
ncbi:TonB-dependent receptor plug domain-containing protein [Saccharicrinis aurantiacus]|uniref:TonB-dependent receptor plug domain-containing protein n=1 Tax=Saccharicrinis aurantiacus TaxID=1849719 RepID=UPI00094F9583|nr:TonB-dependent receptor [Saccharicrinis aurantiacus]